VRTRPEPSGKAETVQASTPLMAITCAAATMSAMESTAPTSWKRTSSGATPCTLASASARWAKMAMA